MSDLFVGLVSSRLSTGVDDIAMEVAGETRTAAAAMVYCGEETSRVQKLATVIFHEGCLLGNFNLLTQQRAGFSWSDKDYWRINLYIPPCVSFTCPTEQS